jgi:broad specificity phosphatase PhoE
MLRGVLLLLTLAGRVSGLRAPFLRVGRRKEVGHLVLVRHGETDWDATRFVGWVDPDLNEMGARQAIDVAHVLKESVYSFDVCYSSVLKRAVHTAWLVLKELELVHLPLWKTWRLNERSYGALTGRKVEQMLACYGEDTCERSSLDPATPGPAALDPGGLRVALPSAGSSRSYDAWATLCQSLLERCITQSSYDVDHCRGRIASWRRSFGARPPAYPADHPFHPAARASTSGGRTVAAP